MAGHVLMTEKELELRDQFAMGAMVGLLSADRARAFQNIAEDAYKVADAMLKARTK